MLTVEMKKYAMLMKINTCSDVAPGVMNSMAMLMPPRPKAKANQVRRPT